MNTESNENTRNIDILSINQKTAITLLCSGFSKAEVARRINIERETVSKWCNHDQNFQQALELRRKEVWGENASNEEAEMIKEVLRTDLFTLEGIEARLRLVDSLLLKDIMEHDEGRTKAIQRLQMNVETVRSYVESVLSGKSINDSVVILTNKYKIILITTLKGMLDSMLGEESAQRILQNLAKRMELIESGKDIANANNKTTNN